MAEQYDGYAVWRQTPDGTLEIATLEDGRLTRHLVHDDGTTTALESFDPSAGYVFGLWLTWLGFAICVLIVVSGAILAPDGVSHRRAALGVAIFATFLAGLALSAIGGTMREHRSDPRWLLRRLGDDPSDWQIPPRLHGWQPTSSQQLAAVEELAEEHEDGVAYVRDEGGATIEALVLRKRRVDSYWIDRLGNVGLSETLPPRFLGTWNLARRVRSCPTRLPGSRSAPVPSRPTTRKVHPVRSLPERYIQLGLRLGKHLDELVDGYFGPPELKDVVDAEEPAAPEALRDEAAALLGDVEGWDEDPQRRGWLAGQVEGLVCVAELASGKEVAWREAVRRCYGIDVEPTPEDRFAAAHEQLDAALPGAGDLAERLQAWNRSQELPAEKVMPAFDALVERLRAETSKLVELPDGERIDAETVIEQPWSAYNWYLGDRKSRIELNTDLPTRSYFFAQLVAHEGYPGHHTEHSCKEARLVQELGRIEPSILLIHTPECLVSEGIAQNAIEQALGEDWTPQAAETLRPLGISFDVDVARAVVHAYHELDEVPVNVAYFVGEEGWSEEQAVAYQQRWGLSEEERARKSVGFATHPVWGIYVPTYAHGYRLVKSSRLPFRTFLTEQVTTADLLETRAA